MTSRKPSVFTRPKKAFTSLAGKFRGASKLWQVAIVAAGVLLLGGVAAAAVVTQQATETPPPAKTTATTTTQKPKPKQTGTSTTPVPAPAPTPTNTSPTPASPTPPASSAAQPTDWRSDPSRYTGRATPPDLSIKGTFSLTLYQSTYDISPTQQFVLKVNREGDFTPPVYTAILASDPPIIDCVQPTALSDTMTITCTAAKGVGEITGTMHATVHAGGQSQIASAPFYFYSPAE